MKPLICLVLLLSVAGSCSAQSSIAYFHGPFPVPAQYGSAGIDFDGDGAPDLAFWSNGTLCTDDVPTSSCSTPYYVGGTGTNAFLANNSALVEKFGAEIGAQAPAGSVWRISQASVLAASWWSRSGGGIIVGISSDDPTYSTGWYGNLGLVTNGFLGVRFFSADGAHYGWVHVRLPEQDANPVFIEFGPVVIDWAYETRPGVSIRAGAKPIAALQAAPETARAGYLRLSWQSDIDKPYQVQFKTNLASHLWSNLEFLIPAKATNSAVDVPITGTTSFYRVVEAD